MRSRLERLPVAAVSWGNCRTGLPLTHPTARSLMRRSFRWRRAPLLLGDELDEACRCSAHAELPAFPPRHRIGRNAQQGREPRLREAELLSKLSKLAGFHPQSIYVTYISRVPPGASRQLDRDCSLVSNRRH